MGKRWKTVKKIEASMENIGNDGKTYRNNRFLTGYFFQSLKRKRKGQENDGKVCGKHHHPGNIFWHLFGVAL
jgi:hypothetical protein